MRDPLPSFTFHGHTVCPLGYESSVVRTDDGVSLTLFRSRPLHPSTAPPVLLIPGLGSNRFTFGLTRRDGLPHVLVEAGRDVWLAELRGSRSARHAEPSSCDVTHKLDYDLPALVAHVLAATGKSDIDLIGHSLGGLLALLFSTRSHAVRKVVTIATPGRVDETVGLLGLLEKAPFFPALARGLEKVVGGLDRLAVTPLARIAGPVPHLAMGRHFLPGAVDAATRRRYLDHAVEDVPGAELAQLMRWALTGELTDARPSHNSSHTSDNSGDLTADLAAVAVPVLTVFSPRDKVVPEQSAMAAYQRIGSAHKALLRVDRSEQKTRDYGHADILLAPSARRDVLEPIADWLNGSTQQVKRQRGTA